ncbi:MAG: hypothetical protein ABIJ34_00515 [archaeon]
MKKGEFGFHLNWIYVTLIGIVIIISAGGLISSIKRSAEFDLLTDVKAYVDNILKNIQMNNDAESEVNLPNVDVLFECDTLTVRSTESSSIPLTDNVLFSPDKIKNNILGYSLYWYMPFDAEFFSYITSPRVKYTFLESPLSQKLYENVPDNLNKEITNHPTDYSDEKVYKIRYITFDYLPAINILGEFPHVSDKDVSAIKIEVIDDAESFPNSFGRVTFHYKKGNNFVADGQVYYFDKATLLGVIYSEDNARYECNLKKALAKLGIMATLKKDKIRVFSNDDRYKNCPYERSMVVLNDLATLAGKAEVDQNTLKAVYDQSKLIKNENILLQRLSCPLIY